MKIVVDLKGNVLEQHEDGFNRAKANHIYNLWWAHRLKRFIDAEKAKKQTGG